MSKLHLYVCTLEQAERLRDFGIRQDSMFSWCGDKNHIPQGETEPWVFVDATIAPNAQELDHRDCVPAANPFAAAYNVTELGIMLPPGFQTSFIGIEDKRHPERDGNYWEVMCSTYNKKFPGELAHTFGENEAHARAEMVIHLLENSIMSTDQINNQLAAIL